VWEKLRRGENGRTSDDDEGAVRELVELWRVDSEDEAAVACWRLLLLIDRRSAKREKEPIEQELVPYSRDELPRLNGPWRVSNCAGLKPLMTAVVVEMIASGYCLGKLAKTREESSSAEHAGGVEPQDQVAAQPI